MPILNVCPLADPIAKVTATRALGATSLTVDSAQYLSGLAVPFNVVIQRNNGTLTSLTVSAVTGLTLTISGPANGYPDQGLIKGDQLAVEPQTPLQAKALSVQGPVAGLVLSTHIESVTTDTDAATITFDCGLSDWHSVVLGGSRALLAANVSVGQTFYAILQQDAITGSRLVTSWFAGFTVKWPGGAAPTLTTATGAIDILAFKCISPTVLLGSIVGQALA